MGTRGRAPGPQLAVVAGGDVGVRTARDGRALGPIKQPVGTLFEPDEQALWDQYIENNPYLDEQDGFLAAMWCREAARYQRDPRGMTASEKTNVMKMSNDLYLTASERNRKVATTEAPKRGAASNFLSRGKN